MQMKDGLDDDLWEMTGQQETVRGPRLWEDSMTMWRRGARRCTYKKRLAEVGLVWWSDVTNEKGDGWMTWSEASRVHELRGKTDKEDYEQLLGELNGQPEATTAQWFAGRHERWDEAGLEWNRSDQRIAIRMAADASTEQRGIRNGQVKGEDKWAYERIDGARRTGETGEDATERWEYLIKWKGATKRTWERHRTIAAMGGAKLEALKEAQDTKLIPFSTRDRIERAATRGEAGMRAMLIAIDTWAGTAGAYRSARS